MWGNKKPDTPQAAQPEPVSPIINQPPKPAPASWEEKPAMSTDSMRPLSATSDRSSARLGSSLHVKGEISGSEDLLIDGTVKGNLRAKDRIEIKKDCSVNGDLTTSRIMIEDGAYFKGSIEIDKTGDKGDSSHNAFSKKDSSPATAGKTI